MNKIFKKIIEIGFFILLYSCVSAPVKPKHNTPFPEKIALLPFDNMSVDIDASFIMENLLESYIDSAGFNLQDRKITYQRLNSIGISDGGQLSSLTTQELGKLLEADALIYGEVREFNNKNIGVYYSRTVEVYIKLIDSKTGYAQKALETITKSPLKQEADDVARMLTKELSKFRKNW